MIELLIPISLFVLPPNACEPGPGEFTWNGETRAYVLHIADSVDQLHAWCGAEDRSCIDGDQIYTPTRCERALAHELSHLFDLDWVDGTRN